MEPKTFLPFLLLNRKKNENFYISKLKIIKKSRIFLSHFHLFVLSSRAQLVSSICLSFFFCFLIFPNSALVFLIKLISSFFSGFQLGFFWCTFILILLKFFCLFCLSSTKNENYVLNRSFQHHSMSIDELYAFFPITKILFFFHYL